MEQMLENADAVAIAKKIVVSSDIQTGLRKLKEMGRTDLTIESIMLENEFAGEFTADELAAARWRLTQA
jgi:hypothetical protein